jgi:hypothetical protein
MHVYPSNIAADEANQSLEAVHVGRIKAVKRRSEHSGFRPIGRAAFALLQHAAEYYEHPSSEDMTGPKSQERRRHTGASRLERSGMCGEGCALAAGCTIHAFPIGVSFHGNARTRRLLLGCNRVRFCGSAVSFCHENTE